MPNVNNTKILTTTTNIKITDHSASPMIANEIVTTGTGADVSINHRYGESYDAIEYLARALSLCWNSVEFKEAMCEDSWFRIHGQYDVPTALMVPTLTSRHVVFSTRNDPWNNNPRPEPEVATIKQGATIRSLPIDKAIMFSFEHSMYDHEAEGQVTSLSLEQTGKQLCLQMNRSITNKVIYEMEQQDAEGKKYFTKVTKPALAAGTVRDKWAVVEEAIYNEVDRMRQFGSSLEDFFLCVSPDIYKIAERYSRQNGHSEIELGIGTQVYQFTPVEVEGEAVDVKSATVFVLPKALVALSFREDANGDILNFRVTRNGNRQCTTMEITGVVEMLCAGFVKLSKKLPNSTTLTDVEVKLPLVSKIMFSQ